MTSFMIYGAYGYTGELIARLAVERGLRPILGGRSPDRLARLGEELDCETRAFQLQDASIVEARLREVALVLHCAGPFARTFRSVSEACLATGTHYLDITGEIDVLESLARRDEAAREAGVMILPGVGFDVVPSDCLARHLYERLPAATHLRLAIQGLGSMSRGTAATVVANLHRGGRVRREGHLEEVPAAWRRRRIDFGAGEVTAVTMPWGDVSTAYHSTGIPNVEVYMTLPAMQRMVLPLTRVLAPILGARPVQAMLQRRVRSRVAGPSEEERSRGESRLWGEVESAAGERRRSRLAAPEGYTLSAHAAVAVVERALAGDAPPGFQTPSRAYGADFVLGLDGVGEWQDD